MSPELLGRVAVHEAGHAILALALGGEELSHVLIGAVRGEVATVMSPGEGHTRQTLLERVAISLAGRAAEPLFTGELLAGSSSDLRQATALLLAMEAHLGMGPLGPVWLGTPDDLVSLRQSAPLVALIRPVLLDLDRQVTEILRQNERAVRRLADALMEQRYLDAAEIRSLVGRDIVPSRISIPNAFTASRSERSVLTELAREDLADA